MSLGLSSIHYSNHKHFAICIFNRATYSRCKELILEISRHPQMKVTLILSSTLLDEEYGNAQDYISKEVRDIDIIKIQIGSQEKTHLGSIKATSEIASRVGDALSGLNCSAVIVVADRYETLGAAYAAAYLNLPLIHIQGGEVTGNIDEKVRHAVTKLSDYHFVATESAKKYLIQMGEERFRVFNTGCPSLDVIRHSYIKRHKSKEKYIVCQFHPDTREAGEARKQTQSVMEAVLEYCAREGFHCYWYWPNPDPGREEITKYLEEVHLQNKVSLIKAINKPPVEFLDQLAGARFLIGNSSAGIRECSFMGVPSINVGDRQSIRERSINVIDCGFNHEDLMRAIYTQHNTKRYKRSRLYGDGRASQTIVGHLSRMEFSLKGPLTYPTQYQFREQHFGEARFESHARHRKQPYYHDRNKIKGEAGVSMDLQSKS